MSLQTRDDLIALMKHIKSLVKVKELPDDLIDFLDKHPEAKELVNDLLALRDFTEALSKGDLSQTLSLRGYWPGSLKTLQSNLRHLTWQTRMVAEGDYSQRVDFMGDFSNAFNAMTIQLKNATENEQKYIEDLKTHQKLIEESERKYRLLAENTDDVIWLLDNKMVIRYMSPSIERLIGYTTADLENKPVTLTPLALIQDFFNEANTSVSKSGGEYSPYIFEWEQLTKERKMVWLESSFSVARNDVGDMIGFIGVTRNITERKKNESLLQHTYERRKRRDFFNHLALNNHYSSSEVLEMAWRDKIYIPDNFSLYLLDLNTIHASSTVQEDILYRKQLVVDALVDHLNRKENTIAWETERGLGIINTISATNNRKELELKEAEDYYKYIVAYIPESTVNIGIANYLNGWAGFAKRLKNAETALRIGTKIWSDKNIYHYENFGVYQVLAPFAVSDEAATYINQMLGPLLEHPDLLETLDKLLSGLSFKEIGAQMFLHHKTIQLRKQRIEQLLDASLDFYETRMALATALQIMKIQNGNNS